MKDLLAVVRNRNLAIILAGRLVSSSGDWLYQVALSVAIFKFSHGSAFLVGLLWVVRLVPSMFLGPIAGAWADRLGYIRSMVTADLARAILVGLLGLVLNQHNWPIIYPIAFTVTCFSNLFAPASIGLIPAIVRNKEERLAANAVVMQTEAIANILGSAIGGFVAGLGYINGLLLVESATFLFSMGSLLLVHPPEKALEEAEEEVEEAYEEVTGEGFLAGYRLILHRPLLVFALAVMVLPELASGADVVWIVPYSEKALSLGSAGVGYLYSALGIGALVGGLVAAVIGSNVKLDSLLAASVLAGGLALVLFGSVHLVGVALAAMAFIGLFETVEYAAYETLLQQAVPERMIGQASGTMSSIFINMMLIGNLLSGIMAAVFGLTYSIVGLGVLIIVVTGIAWWNLRVKTTGQPDAIKLSRIPAFAHVPGATLEWAVRRMVREQYPRDSVIIRQGDEGDKFYAIAHGHVQVEVAHQGQMMTTELGSGDYFGEIALLHDVPRTATVKALDTVTVWALSREDFQELQSRAGEFKESLLDVANARLEESTNFKLALATRAS